MSESGAPSRDFFFPSPGGRLFARLWGKVGEPSAPTPIVVLHDSLGCVELWRDFPATLAVATGRPVVAYDRLGFGNSDPHPGVLAPDFVLDEARTGIPALRAALGIDRMILFGHSVGGAMAVTSGAAFPEATDAVITESAQAFVEERTRDGIRQARATMRAPDQIARLARYHGDKARWVLDAWTETWLSDAFAAFSLDESLRALRCPVLAMHGDRDEFGSLAFPARITTVPSTPTEMVIFEGGGHVPHRERPAPVLETVVAFLGKHLASH